MSSEKPAGGPETGGGSGGGGGGGAGGVAGGGAGGVTGGGAGGVTGGGAGGVTGGGAGGAAGGGGGGVRGGGGGGGGGDVGRVLPRLPNTARKIESQKLMFVPDFDSPATRRIRRRAAQAAARISHFYGEGQTTTRRNGAFATAHKVAKARSVGRLSSAGRASHL